MTEERQNRDNRKYDREIAPGVVVDVYAVANAFEVNCSAMSHALKKILLAGGRGVKDSIQDKEEAIASIERSIELERQKNTTEPLF